MATFLTPNRHGYSVRFSPVNQNLLAVATSQYYGLTGGGTLFLLELLPEGSGGMVKLKTLEWTDGLFDVVWSEQNPNVIITASGDGSLQLWDLLSLSTTYSTVPQSCFREHTKEVYSIDWSPIKQQLMLSASWDQTIKLWDPQRSNSLCTFSDHTELVYSAKFSNHLPNTFASVSGDGQMKLWHCLDQRSVLGIRSHNGEVLSCDWCKFDPNILATAASDGLIRGWDIRNLNQSLFELSGSEYAVRRIQFSPFSMSCIASVSFDFTTRIWDYKKSNECLETIQHHSEFTYGLDWNRLRQNQLADCGWDSLVHVFRPQTLQ